MKKALLILISFILILSGCGNTAAESTGYLIYCLDSTGKTLQENTVSVSAEPDTQLWLDEMSAKLNNGEDVPAGCIPLLTEDTKINSAAVSSGIATVDIGKGYYDLSTAGQLLIRAGLTKTFTQNDYINSLILTVDGKPAVDASGNEILPMNRNTFVDETSGGINNYRSSAMTLYFTDESGKKLESETRVAYYSVNTPVEQAVLNELILGPSQTGHYRTLPPDLNVLNVTIQDGICYVNFDESFENTAFEIDPYTQVYSIVKSIAAVCGVDSVSFSINGSSSVLFKDKVSLDQIFKPDGFR